MGTIHISSNLNDGDRVSISAGVFVVHLMYQSLVTKLFLLFGFSMITLEITLSLLSTCVFESMSYFSFLP